MLTIPIEPNVPPISFARQPPAQMRDRAFLTKLTGEYDAAAPVNIVLREDNVLQYTVLGVSRELVPVRGTFFRVKDLSTDAVEFLSNAAGEVDRMAIYSAGSDPEIVRRKK